MKKGDTIDVKINYISHNEDPCLPYWNMVVMDQDYNEYIYQIPQSADRDIRTKIENEDLDKYNDGKLRAVIKERFNNACFLIKWPNIWSKEEI